MNKKYKIVFVGTGIIGAGLAANAILNNQNVVLYDCQPVEVIRENLKKVLNRLACAGVMEKKCVNEILDGTIYSTDLQSAVGGADMIQECVPERLELKQSIYRSIQEVTGPDAVICSSTSSFFPSKLQQGAQYPGSIMVGHPYNPSYLLPLIEICGGEGADEESVQKAFDIYTAMGKIPVLCRKEIKGFIVNRLSWAALASARESVREGVCSVEDMDKAIMYGPGMRMAVTGQLLTISQGVEGGFRNYANKYGLEESEEYQILAEGIDEELSNRPAYMGNTPEEVDDYRDRMLAEILRFQKLI